MRRRAFNSSIDDYYTFETGEGFLLGQGSMATVSAIKKKETGVSYALKTIQLARISKAMRNELRNEIDILMSLDHPNIIKPLELFEKNKQMYFVMEMCSGGDLYVRLPYSEKQAALYTNQLVSAVRYLHSRAICHRDLKFENILFESKENAAMLKLIDFGLSKEYRPGHRMDEAVGTLYSMAPEVLTGTYSQACDMWSTGVVVYMMLSGQMPFQGSSCDPEKAESEVIDKIKKCQYSFDDHVWRDISDEAKDFVSRLIRLAPSSRMTAEGAINHSWLKREWEDHRKLNSQLMNHDIGEGIVTSLKRYGSYGKLRKAALMVIAHRADVCQIRALRDAFHEIDVSHEGTITLEEMKHVLKPYEIDNEEVESIFNGMDVDESGRIGYTEFLAATVEAHGVAKKEQLSEAFDRLDADDSGFISANNLKEVDSYISCYRLMSSVSSFNRVIDRYWVRHTMQGK